MSKVSLRN